MDRYALAELDEILKFMSSENVSKLPVSLREFIFENKAKTNNTVIKPNIPLHKQKLRKQTMVMLSLLYRVYWNRE